MKWTIRQTTWWRKVQLLKGHRTAESPTGYRSRGPSALRQARVLARRPHRFTPASLRGPVTLWPCAICGALERDHAFDQAHP